MNFILRLSRQSLGPIVKLRLCDAYAKKKKYPDAVAPQVLQFSFGDDPLNSGEMLSLSCTITKGDLPVILTWTFDDQPLLDYGHSDVTIVNNKRVSFLSIDSVAARHAGKYKCTATNGAGAHSHTAVLVVNGSSQLINFFSSQIFVIVVSIHFFFLISLELNSFFS